MPESKLNPDETAGFNLAVDLYTNLMFNQKELMTRIVESAYSAGLNDGIAYTQQQIILAQREAQLAEQQQKEVEESEFDIPEPVKQPTPTPTQTPPPSPKTFADRLKAIPRR